MSTRFGWCMDGHHEGCVVWFRWESGTIDCSCACHEGKEKPELKKASVPAPRKTSRAKASSAPRGTRATGKSTSTSRQPKATPKKK